jgi:pimeloyl-ACP methyl ester carboxylesterase
MLDTSMTLPDGRSLAYTDLGSPEGPLVIYFHGAPTSRLDLVGVEDLFSSLGLRVVSPDRPGTGGSTPQPNRGLNDWPADVGALADHLGAKRFVVLGHSAGGPYAVACAALLPERVAGAGVIAGLTDMAWPDASAGLTEDDLVIMGLADENAAIAWCEDHYGADGSKYFEHAPEVSAADDAWLADEANGAGMFTAIAEAFRQGIGGFAQDMHVLGRPWTFDPGSITAPVRVLQGETDTIVPPAHSAHTAELIPSATLVMFPEHGHLSIANKIPQLADDLATPL